MLVALIGYRGTGKTTIARLAALALGYDWVDADVEVELRAGKSIAKIFADNGEERFRELESCVLAELLKRNKAVLALGGGVVLREENRRALSESQASVIWLQGSPTVLNERIYADPATSSQRPNLTADGGLAEIERLLAERTPLYQRCAHYTIDTDHKTPEAAAAELVDWLQSSDRRDPT